MQTTTPKKKNIYQQISLLLGQRKVTKYLGEIGLNKSIEEELAKVKKSLFVIKKQGAEVPPVFAKEAPKRLSPKEKNQTIIDEYNKQKEAYKQEKSVFDELEKTYNSYVSDKYKVAYLAFRLTKKFDELINLKAKVSETADENKKAKLSAKVETLKEEIKTFKKKKWEMGFEQVMEVDFEKLNEQRALLNKYEQTNEIFLEKEKLESQKTRFGEQLRIAVIYFIQESMKDIILKALKNTGKRQTLNLVDFENINSNYAVFYHDLPHHLSLNEYFVNKKKFEETKKELDKICKTNGLTKGTKISFAKAKINVSEECLSDFTNFVNKLLSNIKTEKELKFSVSADVKSYLSGLVLGYLDKLSKQINIIINRKEKIVKTFDLQSFLMLLKLQLVSFDSTEIIEKIQKKINEFTEVKKLNNI